MRYNRLTPQLKAIPGLIPVTISRGRVEDWADPIVGLSAHWRITDRWFLNALADVGGFGVGSQFTAQGFAQPRLPVDPVDLELGRLPGDLHRLPRQRLPLQHHPARPVLEPRLPLLACRRSACPELWLPPRSRRSCCGRRPAEFPVISIERTPSSAVKPLDVCGLIPVVNDRQGDNLEIFPSLLETCASKARPNFSGDKTAMCERSLQMVRSRLNRRIWLRHLRSKAAMGLAASLAVSGCVAGGEETPNRVCPGTYYGGAELASRSEALIGRWGVASFRQEKDRQRVAAQARAQCKLPYTIANGPTGGVMMHVADDSPSMSCARRAARTARPTLD